MRVLHKNNGSYADVSLSGAVLSLQDGKLTLDLSEAQRDYPVRIDISEDAAGRLTQGVSHRYVAELEIPARSSTVEKTGVADDFGFPVLRRVYAPLDTDDVVLTLWALKEAK